MITLIRGSGVDVSLPQRATRTFDPGLLFGAVLPPSVVPGGQEADARARKAQRARGYLGQIVKAARDEAEIGWRLMYSTDYHAGLPKNAALLFANARTSKCCQPCTLWEFCKMLGPSLGSIPKINKVEPATLPSMRTTYGR